MGGYKCGCGIRGKRVGMRECLSEVYTALVSSTRSYGIALDGMIAESYC